MPDILRVALIVAFVVLGVLLIKAAVTVTHGLGYVSILLGVWVALGGAWWPHRT